MENNKANNSIQDIYVTKDEFKAYLREQAGGRNNMWSIQARQNTGLSKEAYAYIMDNYSLLEEKYNLHIDDSEFQDLDDNMER